MKEIPFTADFVRMYLEKYQGKVFLVRNETDREHMFELFARQKSTEDPG